jgi:hypothetical protein
MGHLRRIITGGCDFCDRLKTNERNDSEWDYRNAEKQTDSKNCFGRFRNICCQNHSPAAIELEHLKSRMRSEGK